METKKECRRKGGRPHKGTADKYKYRVTVKMATEEYYTLKGKARLAGSTTSELVREFIRNGYIKERLSKEQADCVRKLCGMANNLNQLAHKAHAEGYRHVHTDCQRYLYWLGEIIHTIRL